MNPRPSDSTSKRQQKNGTYARREKENNSILGKAKLRPALHSAAPVAAENQIQTGDEFFIYREKADNRWIEPYIVGSKKQKTLTTDTGDCCVQVSIEKVRHYKPSERILAADKNGDIEPVSNASRKTATIPNNVYDLIDDSGRARLGLIDTQSRLRGTEPMEVSLTDDKNDFTIYMTDVHVW